MFLLSLRALHSFATRCCELSQHSSIRAEKRIKLLARGRGTRAPHTQIHSGMRAAGRGGVSSCPRVRIEYFWPAAVQQTREKQFCLVPCTYIQCTQCTPNVLPFTHTRTCGTSFGMRKRRERSLHNRYTYCTYYKRNTLHLLVVRRIVKWSCTHCALCCFFFSFFSASFILFVSFNFIVIFEKV